jgi:hypothetical protein
MRASPQIAGAMRLEEPGQLTLVEQVEQRTCTLGLLEGKLSGTNWDGPQKLDRHD